MTAAPLLSALARGGGCIFFSGEVVAGSRTAVLQMVCSRCFPKKKEVA